VYVLTLYEKVLLHIKDLVVVHITRVKETLYQTRTTLFTVVNGYQRIFSLSLVNYGPAFSAQHYIYHHQTE